MSVVTSTSNALSILKIQNPSSRNSGRFELPSNIKKIIQNYKTNTNSKEYQALVSTIRDAEITDSQLLCLLKEAKMCIPILNYDLRLFVQALNIIKWTQRGDEIVKVYQDFINDLLSAHSQHTKIVIDQLVKLFSNVEEGDWEFSEPVAFQKKQFDNIHATLKSITEKVPLSEDILLECLSRNFPHFLVKNSHIQQLSHLYNMLRIISYQSHLRMNILEIILDKLLLRDVNTPREDIVQAEEQQGEMLYEMEVDEECVLQRLKHPVADTLDELMELLLKFIKNECYEGDKLIQVKCHKLYNEIINLFENIILPTHSHHIQFILFYICSFENTLAQQFLKSMWAKAISPNVPIVIRQTCISYLSGFLARGEYILNGYLKNYLTKISDWINKYISNYYDNSESNRSDHSVFYSMCKAVFYLVAFRHEDLVDSYSKLTFLQGLNLSKIVTCKLNPLRTCPPDLLDHFADVACDYQLAYCYTIIENNLRSNICVVDNDGKLRNDDVTELYYPFDPLLLPRTNTYIKPLYREYTPFVKGQMSTNEDMKNKMHSQGFQYKDGFSPNMSLGLSYEN